MFSSDYCACNVPCRSNLQKLRSRWNLVRHKIEQSCSFDLKAERRGVLARGNIYNYTSQNLFSGWQLS